MAKKSFLRVVRIPEGGTPQDSDTEDLTTGGQKIALDKYMVHVPKIELLCQEPFKARIVYNTGYTVNGEPLILEQPLELKPDEVRRFGAKNLANEVFVTTVTRCQRS